MHARVAVVGCGLIGGSFALALRAARQVDHVVGFDRDADTAARALALGIVDSVAPPARRRGPRRGLRARRDAGPQARAVFATIAPALGPAAIVSDVGSTKRDVIAAARESLATRCDASCRAIRSRVGSGTARMPPTRRLFRDRRVLLTPLAENDADTVAMVAAAWAACGARVDTIAADVHDAAFASVSHLPHLLAFALVAQIAESPDAALNLGLAGSGFRDFTRIAASSPEMWRDIALANRDALVADLDDYRARLDRLRAAVAAGDGGALDALFTKASAVRTDWREDR